MPAREPESQRSEPCHDIPDSRGDSIIPGYPGREGGGKAYRHEPMTRDECEQIQVALGIVLDGMPVERRAIGEGYSLLVPAEYWRDHHPGVRAILADQARASARRKPRGFFPGG